MKNNKCLYCNFSSICKTRNIDVEKCYTLLNIKELDKLTEKHKELDNMSFDSSFINSIVCGMKTETRRVIKNRYTKDRYKIGDVVYLSEDWNYIKDNCSNNIQLIFKSETIDSNLGICFWKKANILPQQFSRYRIKILDIKYQNLHNIKVEDLWKEGFNFPEYYTDDMMLNAFYKVWDNLYINEEYKSYNNPEIVKYSFKLLQPDEIN